MLRQISWREGASLSERRSEYFSCLHGGCWVLRRRELPTMTLIFFQSIIECFTQVTELLTTFGRSNRINRDLFILAIYGFISVPLLMVATPVWADAYGQISELFDLIGQDRVPRLMTQTEWIGSNIEFLGEPCSVKSTWSSAGKSYYTLVNFSSLDILFWGVDAATKDDPIIHIRFACKKSNCVYTGPVSSEPTHQSDGFTMFISYRHKGEVENILNNTIVKVCGSQVKHYHN